MCINVETKLKCGSCGIIIRRYTPGFDGNMPDSDKIERCPSCTACFGWIHNGKDDITVKIKEVWKSLKEWKEKNKRKADWNKISGLDIVIRVKPWNYGDDE